MRPINAPLPCKGALASAPRPLGRRAPQAPCPQPSTKSPPILRQEGRTRVRWSILFCAKSLVMSVSPFLGRRSTPEMHEIAPYERLGASREQLRVHSLRKTPGHKHPKLIRSIALALLDAHKRKSRAKTDTEFDRIRLSENRSEAVDECEKARPLTGCGRAFSGWGSTETP